MAPFKLAVLVPDGAADRALEELGGLTPLQAARTPNMDRVVSLGSTGLSSNIPEGMPPGSDVANLSLLGYDPSEFFGGRGPIEAANLGVEVPDGWTAFRCNLVKTDGERMLDYSAGHIPQPEAERLIGALQAGLGDSGTRFYPGKSYRHLTLLEGDYTGARCTPPHDITDEPLGPNMPEGEGSRRLIELMERSRDVLAAEGGNADMIWLWGQGAGMRLEPFEERYGFQGYVISAVDLVNGLGRLAGLEPLDVPGMTGYLDTNYRGKGQAAADALRSGDFVFVHVEAPDEASHMGSAAEKVRAIENFDEHVVGALLEYAEGSPETRILVSPDHPTLIETRTHDAAPVPYACCGPGIPLGGAKGFSEAEAARGGPHYDRGWLLMHVMTGRTPWPV